MSSTTHNDFPATQDVSESAPKKDPEHIAETFKGIIEVSDLGSERSELDKSDIRENWVSVPEEFQPKNVKAGPSKIKDHAELLEIYGNLGNIPKDLEVVKGENNYRVRVNEELGTIALVRIK